MVTGHKLSPRRNRKGEPHLGMVREIMLCTVIIYIASQIAKYKMPSLVSMKVPIKHISTTYLRHTVLPVCGGEKMITATLTRFVRAAEKRGA